MGNRKMGDRAKPKPHHTKPPLTCTGCNAILKTVNYTSWGTQRFNPSTGSYEEDYSPGNTDLEFSCPNCSAEVDAEAIIGF